MPLADIDAAAKLVGKLLNAAVFKHRYDLRLEHSPVHVGLTRRDSGHSWGSVKGIRLHPEWGLDGYIVCHEMAHVVALRIYGRENIAAHGWQWAEIYLILVLAGMGRAAHDELKASFKAAGIRFTKPRQGRVLTQDQRKALAERLEAARKMRIVGSGENRLTGATAMVES